MPDGPRCHSSQKQAASRRAHLGSHRATLAPASASATSCSPALLETLTAVMLRAGVGNELFSPMAKHPARTWSTVKGGRPTKGLHLMQKSFRSYIGVLQMACMQGLCVS